MFSVLPTPRVSLSIRFALLLKTLANDNKSSAAVRIYSRAFFPPFAIRKVKRNDKIKLLISRTAKNSLLTMAIRKGEFFPLNESFFPLPLS